MATDGTVRVLPWMQEHEHIPDFCIVGEPTCPVRLGDMVKIGRRGSLNAKITVHGTQGHVAYPHRADNPVHRLLRALNALTAAPVDAGTDWFEPSTLQVTSIDVGNPVTNVIPAAARAMLNIRFNDDHTGKDLSAWLRAILAQHAGEKFDLDIAISGESFVTQPGPVMDRLCAAIERETGVDAEARHRRRHLRRPLHLPLLPRGRVRPGRRQHAPGGRVRAGRGTPLPGANLSRHAVGLPGLVGMAAPPPNIPRGPGVLRRPSILRGMRAHGARPGRRASTSSPARSQGFLASLAPLIAFPLVGTVLLLLNGDGAPAITDLLATARGPAGAAGAVIRTGDGCGAGRRAGCASPRRSTGANGCCRCWPRSC